MSGPAPFVWAPSPARVIPLWDVTTDSQSAFDAAPLPLRWQDAPAGSVLDYGLDCTALQDSGDTVNGFAVDPGDLQLVATLLQAGVVYVWLAGGVAGTDYPVTLTVTTARGCQVNRVVRVRAI